MNVLLQEQFLKAVNESLDKCINEDWTHFEFTSGSNPYVAKTEKEKNRILKKYARFNPYEESPGFWVIDDKSNSDLFAPNESLQEKLDINKIEQFVDMGLENMRYKKYDVVQDGDKSVLYWVTQAPFTPRELRIFSHAFLHQTDLDMAFVIARDDSCYDYEEDKKSGKGVFIDGSVRNDLYEFDESLKESMEEIDRKYFVSLQKENTEPGHYYILKDDYYDKDFYADSDEEAIKKFRDGLNESCGRGKKLKENKTITKKDIDRLEKELKNCKDAKRCSFLKATINRYKKQLGESLLSESRWDYTLQCGNALRNAIEDGNVEEVINQLWNGYKELLDAGIIDEWQYDNYTDDLIGSEYWDEDELEENTDWALDNFYDLCDNTRVWIPLNEHFVTTPEYNDACVDIHRQMVAGKISKEEAAEKFRQMDTLLDESHPVTESLWDLVKGYLEEGLNEDLNGSCPFKLTDSVKQVYMNCYDDELGEEIDPNITFQSIYDTLNAHEDVYDCLGVGDSIIRERVFEILADILGVNYDDIYYVWIDKRQNIRLSPKGDGLTESMWEPADKQELERLRQDIKKTKSKLLSQIKRKHGVWENFGQKELRALNDKYAKLHFTPEYNALIDEFRNWCDEQY